MATAAFWTLKYNGVTKSFDGWGSIGGVVRNRQSLGVDTVTFTAPQPYDAQPLFPYFSQIIIYRNDVPWFQGIITNIWRSGNPGEESIKYEVSGPWWYFDKLVFEQYYVTFWGNPANPGYAPPPPGIPTITNPANGNVYLNPHNSRCYLNNYHTNQYGQYIITPTGQYTRLLTGEQIIQALNWVLTIQQAKYGANYFQIGTVTPEVDVITSEVRDSTVAEVIRNQLRLSPDAVTWFDYSTIPPTFHCERRQNLDDVILHKKVEIHLNGNALFTENVVEYELIDTGNQLPEIEIPTARLSTLDLHPRYDLLPPVVTIHYEYTTTIAGSSYWSVASDIYPLPTNDFDDVGFGAVAATVQLQGANISGTTAPVTCVSIPNNVTNGGTFNAASDVAAWWRNRTKLLQDTNVTILSIVQDPRVFTLPRELTSGQVADWMPVSSNDETISASITYQYANGMLEQKTLTSRITSTNAVTGVYEDSAGNTGVEPQPNGLAKFLYDSLSLLQYEGSLSYTEDECSGTIGVQNTVNITGNDANPEWANMLAMVVNIQEDIDHGTTTVSFGGDKMVGAADLVEILRAMRSRLGPQSYGQRDGSSVTAGGLGRNLTKQEDQQGARLYNRFVATLSPNPATDPDPTKQGSITLNPSITTPGTAPPNVVISLQDIINGANLNN